MTDKKYSNALKILKILEQNHCKARLVGGCVRDRILGLEPKDYDIACDGDPFVVSNILKKNKIKVIPTGIKHGTITALLEGDPFEITTLRVDVKTDGRHAEVAFSKSFEEDAKRRDFTINAMSQDSSGIVYDYYLGRQDLLDKKIKFVGNATDRICEDYLRILRFFRFQSRFELIYDLETQEAIKLNASGLRQISNERITFELRSISSNKNGIRDTFFLMKELNIFSEIFPRLDASIENDAWKKLTRHLSDLNLTLDVSLIVTLSALCLLSHNYLELFEEVTARLALTRKEIKVGRGIIKYFNNIKGREFNNYTDGEVMEVIDSLELLFYPKFYLEVLGPVGLIVSEILKLEHLNFVMKIFYDCERNKSEKRLEKFLITSKDILLAYPKINGKKIGESLKWLKKQYRNNVWDKKEDGIMSLRKFLKEPS